MSLISDTDKYQTAQARAAIAVTTEMAIATLNRFIDRLTNPRWDAMLEATVRRERRSGNTNH